MTDNLSHAWRETPLTDIMPTSRLLDDLERAGYLTAGDVLDADPVEMMFDVHNAGPKRVAAIRQKVFDYVKPFGSQGEPQWVLVTPEAAQPAARRSPLPDLVSALCVVTAVGLIVYLLTWWLVL